MGRSSLGLGTLGGVAAVRGLGPLREHRIAPTGLADLVNWGFLVDDGVVLQKDGSLLAGWGYRGPDVSAATPEELNALSRHVNDALLPSTDDWMFHVDAVRRPAVAYAPSAFPDPVAQLIDEERRAGGASPPAPPLVAAAIALRRRLPPPPALPRQGAFVVRRAAA